jgi:hypothetical protein
MGEVVADLTKLVYCNNCGVVAVKDSTGWRTWTEPPPFKPLSNEPTVRFRARRHHCPSCAEHNELLAGGLCYGRDPADAVVYEPVS